MLSACGVTFNFALFSLVVCRVSPELRSCLMAGSLVQDAFVSAAECGRWQPHYEVWSARVSGVELQSGSGRFSPICDTS